MKFDDGQGHLRYEGYLNACRRLGIPAGDQERCGWIRKERKIFLTIGPNSSLIPGLYGRLLLQ